MCQVSIYTNLTQLLHCTSPHREFIQNQERLKPQEERNKEEREKVDELRGAPMQVGTLEEIIDDNHAIVSSATGPEYARPHPVSMWLCCNALR